jgi:hypothetical protein
MKKYLVNIEVMLPDGRSKSFSHVRDADTAYNAYRMSVGIPMSFGRIIGVEVTKHEENQ